ncbi:efflux RND transporter periplasmic adaptor subunit [Maribacter polysaccharolyticus]|uniref:efflux RND transporter periplasmic adaptor subunit n=1 Tax=Maribacter polysaccharolyticus TaxID=3020831 RepID=UPI00237F0B30|nr:efflux RND transporter periplasmic adaptor subunit [Maribacter polysaccharolyticus]MDE3741074.1 efflux RND transporter periplasmic adaptor subunit [Maribacter polysaccharolyticus]
MKKYKNYIIAAGILIIGIILGNVFSGGSSEPTHADGEHEYVQDKETGLWTCSMHPQIKLEEPGNCPICGMELIPLVEEDSSSENIAANEIVMNEEAYQLANIQTTIVEKASASKEIRLLGRVKPDERRLYSQVSHIPGRIERLYLNFTGEKVYAGQKIVRIYSPELISAQKELFEAIKSKDIYPQLYKASRNKLKLWKLSDKQIDAIEATGNVQEQIDILSDHSGYVMKRNVEVGDYVMAGGNLFDIANLSTVWVMFEAYEADIPWININDKVSFTIQAIPGKTFEGRVTYVDPFVSPSTRVAKVRVEVNNPGNKLLPEMYASGIIRAKMKDMENAIVIPKSAVLWTGKRAVVYVKVPHDKTISFVYREIELGQDMGQFYSVADGLEEGEIVATNGVFRIDASAQLLGQRSMMNPEGGKVNTGHNHGGMKMDKGESEDGVDHSQMDMSNTTMEAETDHTDMNQRITTTDTFKGQLEQVFNAYIELKDAFVSDDSGAASTLAKTLLSAMKKVDMKQLTDHKAHNHWMTISKEILGSANSISEISDIVEQRSHFKHLSAHLSKGVKLFGVNQKVYEQFCPMADNNNGAYWLSLDEAIKNPYLGAKMLTCGDTKAVIIK